MKFIKLLFYDLIMYLFPSSRTGIEQKMLRKRFANKSIAYFTKRDNVTYQEYILGHRGALNFKNKRLKVCCEGNVVFDYEIERVFIAELMSRNGIDIKLLDLHGGEPQNFVAYFSYYRK